MKFIFMVAPVIAALTSPVSAENFSTVWTFKQVTTEVPTSAEVGKVFFEQRVLPYRLVRLDQALAIAKDKQLPAGTLLYLVMDKANRMAFCTFKDSSAGNAAKSLFIPALDTRPCLVDDDRDGRFEKMFSVFELYGSVAPTPRGDIQKAKVISPVAYSDANPADAPTDYRLSFQIGTTSKGTVPQLRFLFGGKNLSQTQAYPTDKDPDGYSSKPFNYAVKTKLLDSKHAEIAMTATGEELMVILYDEYQLMKPDEFPKPLIAKK